MASRPRGDGVPRDGKGLRASLEKSSCVTRSIPDALRPMWVRSMTIEPRNVSPNEISCFMCRPAHDMAPDHLALERVIRLELNRIERQESLTPHELFRETNVHFRGLCFSSLLKAGASIGGTPQKMQKRGVYIRPLVRLERHRGLATKGAKHSARHGRKH